MRTKRNVCLSVHDYNRDKLCSLYNSNTEVNGQAYDVFVDKEANGYKELRFNIPYKVMIDGKTEQNHRLQFLQNEYLVSVNDNGKMDWFIINEPNVSHDRKNITTSLTCQHVSSLLKMKNIHLELDDTNGIGTCQAIAATTLNGTGWTLGRYDTFFEADGVTEKIRTLKASSKTGAYQLIQNLCALFNARPVFNGDDKTVDIFAYNPFHNPLNPEVPLVDDMEKVIELNYGRSLNNISRKLDTSSLITRLHVEGAYDEDGYVGIEKAPSNTSGLNFLTDFSYFKKIGMFTQVHEDALDEYIPDIASVKSAMSATVSALLEKETQLIEKWGSCNFGCFDILSSSVGSQPDVFLVYSNLEGNLPFEANQIVSLLNVNGSYRNVKLISGTSSKLNLAENVIESGYTKAVVFFTPANGIIGGKESALASAIKTRDDAQADLDGIDTSYTNVFAQVTPPSSGMLNNDLWVSTDASPISVYKYANSNWDTKVTGVAASYAAIAGKAIVRIQNLLEGTVDTNGLNELMGDADVLAREIKVLYVQYDTQVALYSTIENTFAVAMGDMLRDGYWNDSNYVVGQEEQLYKDALEVMAEMSQPVATYTIDMSDLYEADMNFPDGITFPSPASAVNSSIAAAEDGGVMESLFLLNSGYMIRWNESNPEKKYITPSWQDIDINFCTHIIDSEIGITEWGFVERMTKCYDNPLATDADISVKKSDITGKSFTDILASIATVAEEVRGKADMFSRSRIISSAGEISAKTLQGIIDVNRTAMLSTMSNWGTDNKGNIIFTALDGSSAMMLTGSGFMIANSKTLEGDWNWRTFGSGEGFTADEINTGALNAGLIKILGTEQFYWDADNIYIINPSNPLKQMRIGRYDGTNYGIAFTLDGGSTWRAAFGFDGLNLSFSSIPAGNINGLGDAISETLPDIPIIDTVDVEYYLSTSSSSLQGGSWSTMPPAWENGEYYWSRTKTSYIGDKLPDYTNPVCITGAAGESGESVYSIDIVSTNGNIFRNGIIHATLRAVVYYGDEDITETIDANRFRWTRVSADTASDTLWNSQHFSGSKEITITDEDVSFKASFYCDVTQ